MFTVSGTQARYCDGISRRSFLQIGAVGLTGLSLADLLRADEAQKRDSDYSRKSIVNVFLSGGPSHMDTFDMKPEAPKEFRGEFKPIDTNVPGIQICEHLPRLAAMMNQLAIVRSITGVHDEHTPHQTETGWPESSLRASGGRPSLGSVVAKLHGANNGSAPTFVDLTGHTKHGFLGSVYGAFRPDGEGRANLKLAGGVTVARLDDRQRLLSGLDRLKREADASGSMKAMDSFAQRAVSVITSGEIARALDLTKEDPACGKDMWEWASRHIARERTLPDRPPADQPRSALRQSFVGRLGHTRKQLRQYWARRSSRRWTRGGAHWSKILMHMACCRTRS